MKRQHVHWHRIRVALACNALLALHGGLAAQGDEIRSALLSHRYDDALRLSQAETKLHPDDAQAWTYQGIALNGTGKPHEAVLSIQHALKLSPNNVTAAQAGAQIAYRAQDPAADKLLETVLRLQPANQTAHSMAGVVALERHACPAALDHFRQAGDPSAIEETTTVRIAACQAETGDTDGAIRALERLHAADPRNTTVAYDLATLQVDGHRYREAVALLKALQQTGGPTDADTLNLLGAAYAGNDQVAEAIETYRTASAHFPTDARSYIDLAILSMDHQSPAVALGVMDAAIRANPKQASLYTMRGSIYAQIAKNDAAQADFEMADRLSPSEMSGTIGLGVLLRDESNLDQAQQVLAAKLGQKPDDPVLNYMLADVLMRKGAVPGDATFLQAQQLLESAIQRQPDLAQAHAALGKLDLKAGRNDAAIQHLQAATKLDPRDRTALNQLVAAYRRTNRAEDANRVAAQLAQAVAEERAQETDKNRVHLMMDAPDAAATRPGAAAVTGAAAK